MYRVDPFNYSKLFPGEKKKDRSQKPESEHKNLSMFPLNAWVLKIPYIMTGASSIIEMVSHKTEKQRVVKVKQFRREANYLLMENC